MPLHHPHEETLMRHAARRLPLGLSLAVETHLEVCPQCRDFAAHCEVLGGALLENSFEELLQPDALAKVLQRADELENPAGMELPARIPQGRSGLPKDVELPRALRLCDVTAWQWVAPGMHIAKVILPGGREAGSLLLFKAAPNVALPTHSHDGIELTQVLTGCFSDHLGRYSVGDLVERDEDVFHSPVVDADGDCICLIATENKLVFQGYIARLVQLWTGI